MEIKHLSIVGANLKGTREKDDFYRTPPSAVEALLKREEISGRVLEPACGDGAISKVLEKHGFQVVSIDIADRGYGMLQDYFKFHPEEKFDAIITNPPYRQALKFVRKALEDVKNGGKVCMLLKLVFLESQERYEFFKEYPPRRIYVFSRRLPVYIRGEVGKNAGLICYAWFVWIKDDRKDPPQIYWIAEDEAYKIEE